MPKHEIAPSPEALAAYLESLRYSRRRQKAQLSGTVEPRRALSAIERKEVLDKTGGRCHICGGVIDGKWQADHVLSHSSGGAHAADNYLPAHALCNNYRWDYSAEEFQMILKLGVWLRTQIEHKSLIGLKAADGFLAHERSRARRRPTSSRNDASSRNG